MPSAPRIFGILNITSDSFSDGGRFLRPDAAVAHARALVAAGAKVIDVGAASSHPDAAEVSAAEEIARLEAVLPRLRETGAEISIDSFQTETQRWALAQGVDWLNDVNGFSDASLYDALAAAPCRLVVMHAIQSKGVATRADPPEGGIMAHIDRFFTARLEALQGAGVSRDRLVIDPGMGFFLGRHPDPSLDALARLSHLKQAFGLPVLVSVSRKSFLRTLSGRTLEDAAPMTLAAELWAARTAADFIRTHDVAQLADALALYEALEGRG